jgi:hypothetical protein
MPKLNEKNIYKHKYDDPVFGIGHRLHYYRHLRDLIEGHRAKAADIGFRNKLIREQQTKNYQMEYDRIRNQLEKSVAPGVTNRMLEDRLKQLKKLGAKAVNTIQ